MINWIDLSQDRDYWRIVFNLTLNLREVSMNGIEEITRTYGTGLTELRKLIVDRTGGERSRQFRDCEWRNKKNSIIFF